MLYGMLVAATGPLPYFQINETWKRLLIVYTQFTTSNKTQIVILVTTTASL